MQPEFSTPDRADTPSFDDRDPDALISLAECSELTGLTRHTLRKYRSLRRCSVARGPKPSSIPGSHAIVYRWHDVFRYLAYGETGKPEA